MRLINEWRAVLRRAWSIRLMLLAGLLSGIEVVLPLLDGVLPIPSVDFFGNQRRYMFNISNTSDTTEGSPIRKPKHT